MEMNKHFEILHEREVPPILYPGLTNAGVESCTQEKL